MSPDLAEETFLELQVEIAEQLRDHRRSFVADWSQLIDEVGARLAALAVARLHRSTPALRAAGLLGDAGVANSSRNSLSSSCITSRCIAAVNNCAPRLVITR